jgi:hypothetical protein
MGLSARVSQDLLTELDLTFPRKCPELHETEREIFAYKGKRDLIEFLKAVFEEQNENIMME